VDASNRVSRFALLLLSVATMRYLAAYALLSLGGKEGVTAADVKAFLESSGIEVNEEKLAKVASAIDGKNIDELIKEGKAKMKAISGSSGSGSGSGGSSGAAPAAGKKEEKAEEKEEAAEVDVGGGGLFGGGAAAY
jgi:large subunit ribosomal protein LP2